MDWTEVETDRGTLECGQTQRNGTPLRRSLLRLLAKILDTSKIMANNLAHKILMHPPVGAIPFALENS